MREAKALVLLRKDHTVCPHLFLVSETATGCVRNQQVVC